MENPLEHEPSALTVLEEVQDSLKAQTSAFVSLTSTLRGLPLLTQKENGSSHSGQKLLELYLDQSQFDEKELSTFAEKGKRKLTNLNQWISTRSW